MHNNLLNNSTLKLVEWWIEDTRHSDCNKLRLLNVSFADINDIEATSENTLLEFWTASCWYAKLFNINLSHNISLRKCLHQRILAAASIRVDPDHELAHTI